MNLIYCRRVYMAYKKEKSKRKVSKLFSIITNHQYIIRIILELYAMSLHHHGSSYSGNLNEQIHYHRWYAPQESERIFRIIL